MDRFRSRRSGSYRQGIGPAALAAACGFVLFFAAAAGAAEPAPQPTQQPRPKLALVLSGGGAMGLAHVGVIQELEKLGIRPDLVVGTSMGSVVGGLYAAGLNGAELQKVVEGIDWDSV